MALVGLLKWAGWQQHEYRKKIEQQPSYVHYHVGSDM